MLYGVPIYEYKLLDTYGDSTYNLGDYIQSYAIYEFYRSIGISESDIIYVSIEDLSSYSGPYVIILFNMYGGLLNINISPYIIPVFWGFSFAGYINERIASVLKLHEPIGCRDLTTLNNVRSCGVEAFLSGCITLTLTKRSNIVSDGKYYLIDTPSELDDYIPNELQNKIVRYSHIVSAELPFKKEEAILHYKDAIDRLNTYKNEAEVVVTGRLHCASPCIALGIPVIIVKKNKDTNMGWIERVSPIFIPNTFSNINWYPEALYTEELKTKMIESAKLIISDAARNTLHYDLSYEFEQSVDTSYNYILNDKLSRIVEIIGKENFRYAIWGLGDGGGIAYRLIKEKYPDSECVLCIDSFKNGEFYDMEINRPEVLRKGYKDLDFIFLTTYTGRKQAIECMNDMGLHENRDYSFLLSRVNGNDEYFHI